MEAEEVLRRVDEILVEQFELDPESLVADARLREDLQLDSLDAVDLIALIEKEFQVRLDDKRLLALRTVGEMRDYVVSLCVAAA